MPDDPPRRSNTRCTVGLLGVSEFITPLIGGTAGTAFTADVVNFPGLDAAGAQGGAIRIFEERAAAADNH